MATPYISISKPVLPNGALPADYKTGPYTSVQNALSSIPQAARYLGLTVIVVTGSIATEYWFKEGVNDINLVPKQLDGAQLNTIVLYQEEYDELERNDMLDDNIIYFIKEHE